MHFDRLASAYERLHKDFAYLESEYQILTGQKEQLSNALTDLDSKFQILVAQKEEMSSTILEKDITIWRMQIENERCKAELSRFQNEPAQR